MAFRARTLIPLAALAAPVAALALTVRLLPADRLPAYVQRLRLPPPGQPIGLPPIEGGSADRPLVVIDAGHGGHDPGASGAQGLHEKDVTLALVRALRDRLVAARHVRVALTRGDDRFLELGERSSIARRLGADLFVSVHADAAENGEASGATVYTLSDSASDAVAERLARRENGADSVNGVALQGQSAAVAAILVDLSRSDTARQSQAFSNLVLREGQGRLRFHERPQRSAGFAVLKSLDVPSALVEAGYITTADDAARLTDRAWRADFAASVARAIEIFLARRSAAAAG